MKLLMENWRQYLNEVGGAYTPDAKSTLSRIPISITPQLISRVLKKYHEEGTTPQDIKNATEEADIEVIQGIFLYSSGFKRTKQVLDPSVIPQDREYGPEDRAFDPGRFEMSVNRKEFKEANKIFTYLGRLPNPFPERPLFRGMGMSLEQAQALQVGKTFDLGIASSWTQKEDISKWFAATSMHKNNLNTMVILEIRNPKRGVPIYNLSKSPDEEESIMGGKIKIIEKSKIMTVDDPEYKPSEHRSIKEGEYYCKILCENV
tara:strand:+ start:117 stop:899 length:783 start_codon:yes stop_codon:yes gene_type:complete